MSEVDSSRVESSSRVLSSECARPREYEHDRCCQATSSDVSSLYSFPSLSLSQARHNSQLSSAQLPSLLCRFLPFCFTRMLVLVLVTASRNSLLRIHAPAASVGAQLRREQAALRRLHVRAGVLLLLRRRRRCLLSLFCSLLPIPSRPVFAAAGLLLYSTLLHI